MNRRSLLIFIGFSLVIPIVIIVITQGGFVPKVGNATHDPPSIDDIPEGQLGEAILRGRDLLHDTSNILRSEAASIEDGEKQVNELTTCPALWEEGSLNDGAGMARLSKFAGFIKNNMPQDNPGSLSKQEAANIVAYVLSQDHPEWQGHDDDWPNGGGPTDIMTKELREQVKNDTIDWDKVLGKRK